VLRKAITCWQPSNVAAVLMQMGNQWEAQHQQRGINKKTTTVGFHLPEAGATT
jgi:hypothetical protein